MFGFLPAILGALVLLIFAFAQRFPRAVAPGQPPGMITESSLPESRYQYEPPFSRMGLIEQGLEVVDGNVVESNVTMGMRTAYTANYKATDVDHNGLADYLSIKVESTVDGSLVFVYIDGDLAETGSLNFVAFRLSNLSDPTRRSLYRDYGGDGQIDSFTHRSGDESSDWIRIESSWKSVVETTGERGQPGETLVFIDNGSHFATSWDWTNRQWMTPVAHDLLPDIEDGESFDEQP